MGTETTQYIVGDPVVTPPRVLGSFSESVVYMPGTYLPVDHVFSSPHVPNHTAPHPAGTAPQAGGGPAPPLRRADYGLPDTAFVFCCFNALYKIDPQVSFPEAFLLVALRVRLPSDIH
jgi:protein O-GlcNAc transferase